MGDRTESDAQSVSDQDDPLNGPNPERGADEVLLTELTSDHSVAEKNKPDIHQLIDDYSKFLFGYAYRLAGSVSDSEDLTQQTFLIAHQKLDQLRTPSAAKSWLCAILRSCWLKSIRRNTPLPASNFEFELGELLVAESGDTEIDSQAIQLALNDLPPDYRLVLVMYYFEDLSYQEIANRLQVKMGTVMSRLSRAKERIRRRIGSRDHLLDQ